LSIKQEISPVRILCKSLSVLPLLQFKALAASFLFIIPLSRNVNTMVLYWSTLSFGILIILLVLPKCNSSWLSSIEQVKALCVISDCRCGFVRLSRKPEGPYLFILVKKDNIVSSGISKYLAISFLFAPNRKRA
jgi:hypothetical protein